MISPRRWSSIPALRMTMRVWAQPDPWPTAEAFCRGYARSATLSLAEVTQLPTLMRLRSAMGILWALGRGMPLDAPRLLEHMGYLRNTVRWLDQHGDRLTELATRTLTEQGDA